MNELWGGGFGRMAVAKQGLTLPAGPNFSLSITSVATLPTGQVLVGEFTIINAPPGCTIRIKETAGASGDDTGFAVVNG